MKEKIVDDVKDIFTQVVTWVKLEVEYAKLTAAEKCAMLMATLVMGLLMFLIGLVLLIVLSIMLIDVFRIFLAPWLACLCVAGILIVLMLLIFFLRKYLLINPIARFITKLFLNPGKSALK